MNATTNAPETIGYWENKKTDDCGICPFCGQATDFVGYYDRGTYRCRGCGARAVRVVVCRNKRIHTFTRAARLERPWATIDCLHGATLLGAPDTLVSRMKVGPDQQVCPCCGDKLAPVVWEVTEYGYAIQRAYMYCDDCGIYCRAWLA